MSRSLFVRFGVSVLLCAAAAAGSLFAQPQSSGRGGGGPDRPINVDCTRGEKIARALERFPERTDSITIDIRGFCQEQLLISRRVIIRGTNPLADGITSPAKLGTSPAMIEVDDVRGSGIAGSEVVRFEHLSITGGPGVGVRIKTAQVGFLDVTISGHQNQALVSLAGGGFNGETLRIINNANLALNVLGGRVSCLNCEFTDNNPTGGSQVNALAAGVISLTNATLTGNGGVFASTAGTILMVGGAINAQTQAAGAQLAGQLQFQNDVQVNGILSCGVHGSIDSRQGAGTMGLNQLSTAAGGSNWISNGCGFVAGIGTTVLAGTTTVSALAFMTADGPVGNTTLKFNAVNCVRGGKVMASGGAVLVDNVPGIPAVCQT